MDNLFRLYYIQWIRRFIEDKKFKGKWRLGKFLDSVTPELRDNVIVKTKNGFKLKISPLYDKGIEKKIFENGIYEEGTLWCFQQIIKKGDIIFDLGANIGLTTIHASKLTGKKGRVYAFEPMPTTFNILNENIRLNRIKNVLALNFGLSDKNKKGEIFPNLHINRGAASIYAANRIEGVEIDLKTLDSFISNNNIDKVDFIKIDIEGAEVPMLKGANIFFSTYEKPIICIEFSKNVHTEFSPYFIYDYLNGKLNYDIFKQLKGKESLTPLIKINSKEELPKHDNLYCFQQYHYKRLPKDFFFKNS
ncbi:hypothetical protein APR41_12020 [Salegentibacter salinarum]|uniref:Methyltransferase FkbM domain-containing protein n=1 Tax=Salegentibacter salinarum TaxID=447422 RepID=A0A2N0U2B2_9FLAO|nr:FkbM family methyltransferase [Salegentibacter salinarum]PKD21135.1 hypothetical protein APR41_12020 [Salegentibacter salinarum]SKB76325.1 methyltransferase, FkbM family [Salegentibacter salinarum]